MNPRSLCFAINCLTVMGFLGCSSPTESSLDPLACRASLECNLLEAGPCTVSFPELDACKSQHCPTHDNLGVCVTKHCKGELRNCYFGDQSGNVGCAATWRCFGDCIDDENCLNQCLSALSQIAQTLFVSAEVCTDLYVFLECNEASGECDHAAAITCSGAIGDCVDDHSLTLQPWMSLGCATINEDPASCEKQTLRIMAACPTQDATVWQLYLTCIGDPKSANKGCTVPALSEICQELLLLD